MTPGVQETCLDCITFPKCILGEGKGGKQEPTLLICKNHLLQEQKIPRTFQITCNSPLTVSNMSLNPGIHPLRVENQVTTAMPTLLPSPDWEGAIQR